MKHPVPFSANATSNLYSVKILQDEALHILTLACANNAAGLCLNS